MTDVFHRKLPNFSTLLSGRRPRDDGYSFESEGLQVWFNNTEEPWRDEKPHAHLLCDEFFLVLKGTIVLDVEGEEHVIGPREYCFVPRKVFHSIVRVHPPVESVTIRAPSIDDKIYRANG